MKETREILNTLKNLVDSSTAVLATVVDVDGSSFRLPGAKMLILEDGTTVGTVSGGCLEADVLERAAKVRASGKPSILTYDTTNDEDSIFSLNMGCRGIIRILMEPAKKSPAIKFLEDNFSHSRTGVIATQISGENVGDQVIVDDQGLRHSGFRDPHVTQAIVVKADDVMQAKFSEVCKVHEQELYLEYVPTPVRLMIFGAGADASPLARIAGELGWKTYVTDHRPAYANRQRFPGVDGIANPDRDSLVNPVTINNGSIAVVMTHNFDLDKQVIRSLLSTNIRYIGQMGPKSRTERMLAELEESGLQITGDMRLKIFGPVGLDIGATTPEGIALSIVAEIQTFLSGRDGGFLKNREGSIYGRG